MHRVYRFRQQHTLRTLFVATLLSTALGLGTSMAPAQAEPAVPSPEASSSTEVAVQTPSETPAPSGEDRAALGATASSEMTLTN